MTDRTEMLLRIYLNGGRMLVGIPGDGDPLTPYRVRFVGHVIAGSRGAA